MLLHISCYISTTHVLINRFRLPTDQCLFLKVNIAIIINGVSYDYYLNSCYLNEKCVYLCPCLHLYSCLSISAFSNNLIIDINLLIGLYSAQYHSLLTYLWLQILLPVLANWCDVAVFFISTTIPTGKYSAYITSNFTNNCSRLYAAHMNFWLMWYWKIPFLLWANYQSIPTPLLSGVHNVHNPLLEWTCTTANN